MLDATPVDPSGSTVTNHQTETGAVLGTPRYMSPATAASSGSIEVDGRSDLWSLAVIAFQCLTGEVPFQAETMGALSVQICASPVPVPSSIAGVPEGFDAWFAQATQRDREKRFQTVPDFADALAAILTPDRRWLVTSSEGEPPDPVASGRTGEDGGAETKAPAVGPTDSAPPRRSRPVASSWRRASPSPSSAALGVGEPGSLAAGAEPRRRDPCPPLPPSPRSPLRRLRRAAAALGAAGPERARLRQQKNAARSSSSSCLATPRSRWTARAPTWSKSEIEIAGKLGGACTKCACSRARPRSRTT